MASVGDIRDQGLLQIFIVAAQVRRAVILNALIQSHGPRVISGPFAGMTLLPDVAWGDGDLPPKLLGCYEQELHAAIAKAISRNPKAVVNIGCAEGYYAVGMAKRLPQAQIVAFDSSETGQEICRRAAAANHVAERVTVGGKCELDGLRRVITQTERPLLIVDCEGAELDLLDPVQIPEISRCDMIVEAHDFENPKTTDILNGRFASSHDVENVIEGSRDPNAFATLRAWPSLDRWLAVNENRPGMMNWLVCWAR